MPFTRPIVDLLKAAGFTIKELDVFYETGARKFAGAESPGIALSPNIASRTGHPGPQQGVAAGSGSPILTVIDRRGAKSVLNRQPHLKRRSPTRLGVPVQRQR